MKLWIKLGILCGVSVVLLVGGVVTAVIWRTVYDKIFKDQLTLTPTSTNYGLWKETPIPMYLKLYMFNWTNSKMFHKDNDIKPHFREMGPYVFRQVDYKVRQVWNDNGTITFQRRRIWTFEESMSSGLLSDKVTTLNPIATSVGYTLRYKSTMLRDFINRLMLSLGHKLTVTRTVGELLFDGYKDPLLVIAKKLNMTKMPYTSFGWFYGRNGSDTYDGTFNMLTGKSSMLDIGMLKEWNYKNRTSDYYGDCGLVSGSSGDLWPPLPDNKTISIFVSDICTDLKLKYNNESVYRGLVGNKYISDHTMLDNGTNVPARSCYCHEIDCVPNGMLNISRCKYEAPVFVSLPHFYLADPSYIEALDGMRPDKEKHEMFLTLQPTTGVPMQVKAQLQLNLLVQPDSAMSLFKNVKRTFIPMMWFTQEANLTSHYANTVKLLLILPSLGVVTAIGIAAIGMLLFFIGVFIYIRYKWRGEDGQTLLPRNDPLDAGALSG